MTTPPTPGPQMPEWERDLLRAQPVELDAQPARNRALSLARTVVPVLWGALLTFLATRLPGVHSFVAAQETILIPALEAVITGAWYALFRWAENHLPAWLTRIVLGANAQPVYQGGMVVDSSTDEVR